MEEKKQFRPRLSEEEYKMILSHRGESLDDLGKSTAKILVFDIETAPYRAFVWRFWQQNVYPDQVDNDWFMLTWSAKWLFDDKVMSDKLTPKEAVDQDDKRITKSIWDLMNEADIVIAHNGDGFDLKMLNTKFLIHGFNNPSPYQSIDTKKHAKRHLAFGSNSLDNIARHLGLPRKIDDGGFTTWSNCYKGDQDALNLMEEYNIHDVKVLEDVYLALRPYIKPHPNLGLFIGDDISVCPTCASQHLYRFGEYATTTNIYEAYKCTECGSVSRSRKTSTPISNHRNLKTSLPR